MRKKSRFCFTLPTILKPALGAKDGVVNGEFRDARGVDPLREERPQIQSRRLRRSADRRRRGRSLRRTPHPAQARSLGRARSRRAALGARFGHLLEIVERGRLAGILRGEIVQERKEMESPSCPRSMWKTVAPLLRPPE